VAGAQARGARPEVLMETIVLERRLDPPLQLDDIRAMEEQGGWCLELHRVRHVTSLLSLDGRRLFCSFEAPDAEAVRSVLRRLDLPFERVWPATVHPAPSFSATAALADAGSSLVLVERQFAGAVDIAAIEAIGERGVWCLEQRGARFLRAYFALDQMRMISVYAAPDAESVRVAQRQAGMAFEDAWSARVHDTQG
jgi:Protein of unknown function (DUF4242)